jgi:hypothetical protein
MAVGLGATVINDKAVQYYILYRLCMSDGSQRSICKEQHRLGGRMWDVALHRDTSWNRVCVGDVEFLECDRSVWQAAAAVFDIDMSSIFFLRVILRQDLSVACYSSIK